MINLTSIKVPKKYHEMIEEIFHDSDGYWCYTERGYQAAGTDRGLHVIHEDTHREVLDQIRQIEPCDCEYCKGLRD